MDIKDYEQLYSNIEYHWGKEPNRLVIECLISCLQIFLMIKKLSLT
jgi:hypothetical protein